MGIAGHRRFAAFWDWSSRREGKRERELRKEVVAGATGKTLEIGYGVGSNWPFLPASIEYVGIEPDPFMRERAIPHLPKDRALVVLEGNAHALAFEDATFDTVLGILVFCTIPNADQALAEVRRVLKPGGELRFLEHVRAEGKFASAVQNAIAPLWKRLGGGCHPNRDTLTAIQQSGFVIGDLRRVKIGPMPAIVGLARPASEG